MEMTIADYKNGINGAIHEAGFKPFFIVTYQGTDLLVEVDKGNEMLPHYDELKEIIDRYIKGLKSVPQKLKVNYSNGFTSDILYVSPNFKY